MPTGSNDIISKIYTKAELDRNRMNARKDAIASGTLTASDISTIKAEMARIARSAYVKWAGAVRNTFEDTQEAGGLSVDDDRDSMYRRDVIGNPSKGTGPEIFYYIAANNINEVYRDGAHYTAEGEPIPLIPMEVEIISADDFRTYVLQDIHLAQGRDMAKIAHDPEFETKANQIDELYTSVYDEFTNKFDRYYNRFNNMLHGLYNNQEDPRIQFLVDDGEVFIPGKNENPRGGAIAVARSIIYSAKRHLISSNIAMGVNHNGDIAGARGNRIFTLASVFNLAMRYVARSAFGRFETGDGAREKVAADIVRFGLESPALHKYTGLIQGVNARNRLRYESDEDLRTNVISNPAFLTYDDKDNSVLCPVKLYSAFCRAMGFDKDNVSINLVRQGFADFVKLQLSAAGSNELSLGARLNMASQEGVLVPLYVVTSDITTSLNASASAADDEGSTGGAAERTAAMINDGMMQLADTSRHINMSDVKYAAMVTALAGDPNNPSDNLRLSRINHGGFEGNRKTYTSQQQLLDDARADSEKVINWAMNTIAKAMICQLYGSANVKFTTGMRDSHATFSVSYTDPKTGETSILEPKGIIAATRKKWRGSIYPSVIAAILDFLYDSSAGETDIEISVEQFEPNIFMDRFVQCYVDSLNPSAEMATVATAYTYSKASRAIDATNANVLYNMIGMLLSENQLDGDSELCDVRPGPGIKAELRKTLGPKTYISDRQHLISDWVLYLDALAGAGSDYSSDENSEFFVDDKMSVTEIVANLCKGNPEQLINSFTGAMREYLSKYFAGPGDIDRNAMVSLAQAVKAGDDEVAGMVEFDPAIATDMVKDATGKTIGDMNSYTTPAAIHGRRR